MLAIVEIGGNTPVFGITYRNGQYFQVSDGVISFFKSKDDIIAAFCFNQPNIVRIMFKPGHVIDIHDVFENQRELQDKYSEDLI